MVKIEEAKIALTSSICFVVMKFWSPFPVFLKV